MKTRTGRYSTYLLNYHVVWIPKYRRNVLCGEIKDTLLGIFSDLAAERNWDIVAVEIMIDHIHLFVLVPPTVRPTDLVKVLKGVSARKLLKKYSSPANKTGRGTLWAPSFFISTAGNVSSATIQKYIEEQRSLHSDQNAAK